MVPEGQGSVSMSPWGGGERGGEKRMHIGCIFFFHFLTDFPVFQTQLHST